MGLVSTVWMDVQTQMLATTMPRRHLMTVPVNQNLVRDALT